MASLRPNTPSRLYERADAGELNPARVNFREEFGAANAILTALDAGKDPFAGKHGDGRRAYRSAVDNTLQPYRLFIPESYDGSKPAPLLIALHGMGGDENSMFDSYANGLLKREAERVGFIVACPKGRDRRLHVSWHGGERCPGCYGGGAAHLPDRFHANLSYGPLDGSVRHVEHCHEPTRPLRRARAYLRRRFHCWYGEDPAHPEYVVHGDDDRTVAVIQSRNMVEAGKKAGAEIVYVEVPGGSHVSVAAPAFPAMLDFFARQQKHAATQ